MAVSGLQKPIEQVPCPLVCWVTRDHLEINNPALHSNTPANHHHLQAISLDVDGAGQHQNANGECAEYIVFLQRSRLKNLGLGLLDRTVPHLSQARVVKNLHGLKVASILGTFGLLELLGQISP
ncbi:hypothetical protein D3C76_1112260 [compost metagenome]